MRDNLKRPWFRFHLLTAVLMARILAWLNFCPRAIAFKDWCGVNVPGLSAKQFGWPEHWWTEFRYSGSDSSITIYENGRRVEVFDSIGKRISFLHDLYDPSPAYLNMLWAALITLAVAFLSELIIRT